MQFFCAHTSTPESSLTSVLYTHKRRTYARGRDRAITLAHRHGFASIDKRTTCTPAAAAGSRTAPAACKSPLLLPPDQWYSRHAHTYTHPHIHMLLRLRKLDSGWAIDAHKSLSFSSLLRYTSRRFAALFANYTRIRWKRCESLPAGGSRGDNIEQPEGKKKWWKWESRKNKNKSTLDSRKKKLESVWDSREHIAHWPCWGLGVERLSECSERIQYNLFFIVWLLARRLQVFLKSCKSVVQWWHLFLESADVNEIERQKNPVYTGVFEKKKHKTFYYV